MQNPLFNLSDLTSPRNKHSLKTHMVYDVGGFLVEVYNAQANAEDGDACQRILLENTGTGDPINVINTQGVWNAVWDTIDFSVPKLLNYSTVISGITDVEFTFTSNVDKDAEIFGVLVEKGANVPRSFDVINGQGYRGDVVIDSFTGVSVALMDTPFNVVGLNPATDYVLYVVVRDSLNVQNVMTEPFKFDILTLA